MYDKLVAKVNNIDTSDFVLKTNFNIKLGLENKILSTNGLVKKTGYNTKITKIENEIPDISGLATKTALTTVENKIYSYSGLVKKQTIILRLLILNIYSIIIIMINMLLLQSLML